MFRQHLIAALSLACWLAAATAGGAEVEVYSVLPLTPETATRLHVTIDGLFGGVLTSDPLLPSARFSDAIPKRYESAAAYAKAVHAAGLRVGGHIHGTQLVPEVLEHFPGLDQAACRSAKGEVPYFDKSQGGLFMCANNPAWRAWQVERGKRAIDAGADVVLIDEVQGNALALNPAVGSPGFCPACRKAFERFMREEERKKLPADWADRVGWSSIFKRRLSDKIEREPLVRDFVRFQTQAQYAAVRDVVKALRQHAKQARRDVEIGANVSFLDSFSVLDYWFRGVFLTDLLDFTAFECQYNPSGEVRENLPLPRGKWLAWHKLADAVSGDRPVGLVSGPTIGKLTQDAYGSGPKRAQQLAVLFAEAYSLGSAVAFYTLELPGLEPSRLWGPMARMAAFVRAHPDLYDRRFEVPTDVAILYRDGPHMATRNHAYLGMAQALAEANLAFEVLYVSDPDAHPRGASPSPLRPERLRSLHTILIPNALDLSPSEVGLVRAFVDGGGRAVVVDGAPFGQRAHAKDVEREPGAGRLVVLSSDAQEADPGTRFYHDYRAEDRARIVEAAGGAADPGVSLVGGPPDVLLYPYRDERGGRVIVHVVNYRYDEKADRVAEVASVKVRLRGDAGARLPETATLLSPELPNGKTLALRPVAAPDSGPRRPQAGRAARDVEIADLETYAVLEVKLVRGKGR